MKNTNVNTKTALKVETVKHSFVKPLLIGCFVFASFMTTYAHGSADINETVSQTWIEFKDDDEDKDDNRETLRSVCRLLPQLCH
ncbi:hypothetical protein PN836_010945 [Ningiella sp. W23]|uniref:hypothetical protein n=1 Tax=Ningiella sp. W23 TaxID=3023715 RepID=UPI003757349A